jgi:nicotinamidase-related amidase
MDISKIDPTNFKGSKMHQRNIFSELPVPHHFDPQKVSQVWRVPYAELADQSRAWAEKHNLQPGGLDPFKIALLLVDVQNTFCIPGFELYVGGRSGSGAVDDNIRLAEFIYRNLGTISHITLTLDTHQAAQIFHPLFLVNDQGQHPPPYSMINHEDIQSGKWQFNQTLAADIGITPEHGQAHLQHYTNQLAERGKFNLTIWPYHAMLGGIGHAVVSTIDEAVFFHTIARNSRADFEIKGANPLTEHYSVIGPEVLTGPHGEIIGEKSTKILRKVQEYDAVVIAGQAKSHCVAWSISDLLEQIQQTEPNLVGKIYLLEDCTSPVVVPGAIDYTEQADAEFARFAESGMHLVYSTDPISSWPGIPQQT